MSKELKLTDREWGEFKLEDIVHIISGQDIYERERLIGDTPYITATANRNGVGYFVSNTNATLEKDCLSVNRNGSVGYCFYHPYFALFGNDTRKLRLKFPGKYQSLFLSRIISNQRIKYCYGYKMGTGRLRRQTVLLPISSDGTPDWTFMEAYMKQVEEELLSRVRPKLEEQLLEHIITLGALEDRAWREFYFSEIFTRVQRGKRLKKDDHIEGTIPYISSTATNNGIDGFVGNRERVRIFTDCISLANSGSVGSAFFQEFEFVASDHITSLQKEGIDKYAYLFMLPIISRLSEKYSFNREINDLRISRERLMLPIQADSTPDWEFMSAFMKKVEQDTLSKALLHFSLKKSKQMLMGGE